MSATDTDASGPKDPPLPQIPIPHDEVASALRVVIAPFMAVQRDVKRFITQYVFVTVAALYMLYGRGNYVVELKEWQLLGARIVVPHDLVVVALGLFLFLLHLRIAYVYVLGIQMTTAIRELLLKCQDSWQERWAHVDALKEVYRMTTRDAYFIDALLIMFGPDAEDVPTNEGWGMRVKIQKGIALSAYVLILVALGCGAHLVARGAVGIQRWVGCGVTLMLSFVHCMFPIALGKLQRKYATTSQRVNWASLCKFLSVCLAVGILLSSGITSYWFGWGPGAK